MDEFKLGPLIRKIENANIRYGLYAGAYVSAITSNRTPTDIDFLVADEDFEKLKYLFPNAQTKENGIGGGQFLYPDQDHKVEFLSKANVVIDGSSYQFRLTNLASENVSTIKLAGLKMKACDPVDTILLKAMLQRGIDKGKHDVEDIEALLKFVKINKNYLSMRLSECGSDERLLKVLSQFDLL